MLNFLRWAVLSCGVLLLVGWSHAEEHASDDFGVIHLSADAEKEVKNDLLTATLQVQAEDNDPAQLANMINATMGWALSRLKPMVTVKHRTRNYQTNPLYDRKREKVIGWRAQQTLEIESDNFEAAGKAIEILQERLQMSSMRLTPKPATRKAAEDKLINVALDAFKARAMLVQQNFGATDYRIKELHVNTHSKLQPPHYERAVRTTMESSMAAPAIAGGSSQVLVQIQGSIQLN